MSYSLAANLISATSTRQTTTALTDKTGRNNLEFTGKYSSNNENKCSTLTLPKITSRPSDSHPLLTKPKLLRKRDTEIKHYKELVLKKSIDCANAISGEQSALEREGQLRRQLRELKTQNKTELRVEKLRNRERFSRDTERLRWQRDEARIMIETKDILIRRSRMRIKQLEELQKQREKEINQMKQELDIMKNIAMKNL